MTTEQAAKEVKECAMYLAMFENEEGNEELKAALHAKWLWMQSACWKRLA